MHSSRSSWSAPAARPRTQLFVKQVNVQGRRYVVCCNEAKVERIVAALGVQLKRGDKVLRCSRPTGAIGARPRMDRQARREGALRLHLRGSRTNATLSPFPVVLRYRHLLQRPSCVPGPIFLSSDAATRGCCSARSRLCSCRNISTISLAKPASFPQWAELVRNFERD